MNPAVFLGLATVDVVYEVDALPRENEKSVARRQQVLGGGPAANAAITCAFLGSPGTFIGVVGCHPLTSVIRDEFRNSGVSLCDLAAESDELLSISSIFVNPRMGSRTIVSGHATRREVAASAFDPAMLAHAGLLMVDGHQMAFAIAAAGTAKQKGISVVLDGGSWKGGTDELLSHINIAICSDAFRPPGTTTAEEVISYLIESGVAFAAITRGADSILWASGAERGEVAVPATNAIDTLGAGDIFHGAFCRNVLGGNAFVDALKFAASVASYSCQFFGTRAWMQSWRDH